MPLPELLGALAHPPEILLALRRVPGLRLVGGYLRRAYYGQAATDLDLTCELPLEEAAAAVAWLAGGAAFAINERFATRRIVAGDYTLDISQLTGGNVETDIARRDYTVNTLTVPLERLGPQVTEGDLAGHPQATGDLYARTLRMVSRQCLADDPLRILRGYRLCATERITPEPATREAWAQLAADVMRAAPERIHEELLRWFAADSRLPETLEWCAADGVLWQLFPGLRELADCIQGEGIDVWSHTLDCLHQLDGLRAKLPPELASYADRLATAWAAPVSGMASAGALTRIALLLHDIAKPATRAVAEDGKLSFHDHQALGAQQAAALLSKLKFSGDEAEFVLLLIREHLRLGYYSDYDPLPPRLVYRYLRRVGAATPLLLLHSIADCRATRGDWTVLALRQHVRAAAQLLAHHYAGDGVAAPPLLLDGEAIMQLLGLKPGKLVGELKDALLEATAAGEVTSRADAEAFLRLENRRRSMLS